MTNQISHLNLEQKWIEINDESRGTYNVNSQIKFKTTLLKSSLCDYGDAYIIVKGKITITGVLLVLLGSTAVASAVDAGIHKKNLRIRPQ